MLFVCHSKILHKRCLKFLLEVKMAPRETENNAYAKFEKFALRQTQTAGWQINEVNIVEECSNRFPIPKLDL